MYSGGRGHLFESKVVPLSSLHCFLKSGVPDEVSPRSLQGWRRNGRKTLSLTSFLLFSFVFLGFFHQHPGNGGRPCLDPYIAWPGHKVMGGRDFRAKMGIPLRLGSVHGVKTVDFKG